MEDESWDSIDWDQKISDENKPVEEKITEKLKYLAVKEEEDGNYYEINKNKQQQTATASKKAGKKTFAKYVTPYAYKDLCEINSFIGTDFQKIVFGTFGEIERFLMTHEQDLSDESLVELLKIDVALLRIPFIYHNRLLLDRLIQIGSFWKKVFSMIREFYSKNCKDPKYMLLIDTKGFFENLESLVSWLITHSSNSSSRQIEIVQEILTAIHEGTVDNANLFFNGLDASSISEMQINTFEILPSLSDLQEPPKNLEENVIKGKYKDVMHYLRVHLSLLKEDFIFTLRNGFNQLKGMKEIQKTEKCAEAWIVPRVKIHAIWEKVWNIKCPLIIAQLNTPLEIFNGQLICLTTSKSCEDLIVATVLRNSHLELLIPKNSIIIEVMRVENLDSIFDRELIMIEPKSFFDPFHQVFSALKSLNEYNFPMKERVLKLLSEKQDAKYEKPELFAYKNHSFKLDSDWEKIDFGLKEMQLKALKSAIKEDFTILVGPPGTGKSFIGVEIVKILLENTNEKILVLTQTNSALDKFLLGCLKFTNKIARFGGQCKEKELASVIVKHSTSEESKKYLRKLQLMQRDIVSSLLESEARAEDIFKEISFHYRLVEEVNQLDTFNNTKDKQIFAMTTSFAVHNSSLAKLIEPGVVIVEEASEILESHILASLHKNTSQIIMIGDHHQLRPQTNSHELQRKFNFNISLYERLIMNQFPHITLDVQMRMRPEFCDLIRETIYKDLKDGENVKSYPDVRGVRRNFFFFNHTNPESSSDMSKENSFEVEFLTDFYKKLLSVGNHPNEITILTPYAAQAKKFNEKFKHQKLSSPRIAVLDAYQGEESEIILLSLVRSNQSHDIGFLAFNNRINVILSRAKVGFYICGNMNCFTNASKLWKNVGLIFMRQNAIGNEIPKDFFITRNRLSSKN